MDRALYCEHAFFCKRTILVHFFSSNVSYFFTVAASNTSSGRFNSSLSAAAVFGRLFAERYAMIDLCLRSKSAQSGQFTTRRYTHSSSACRSVNKRLMLGTIDMSQPLYKPAMRQSSASSSVRGSVVKAQCRLQGRW